MSNHRFRLAATAVLTLFAVTACGSKDDPQPADPPELGAIPVVRDSDEIKFPIDSYYLSEQEDLTIQRARSIALQDCMAEQGFTYQPPPAEPQLAAPSRKRVFGQIDIDEAVTFGYHAGPANDEKALEAEKQAAAPTAEEDRALTGLDAVGNIAEGGPEGGCLREAERRVGASAEQLDVDLLENIALEASAQAEADSRLIDAFTAWSKCMKSEGYNYQTTWDANDDAKWAAPEPTAEERAVAEADVRCKTEGNLPGLWLALMNAYQERLIEQNALALNEWEAAKKQALSASLEATSG